MLTVNQEECLCCHELEGRMEALDSEEVQRDVNETLLCVTDHPGFESVCLKKWSLHLAADKYKTIQDRRYDKSGQKERFVLHCKMFVQNPKLLLEPFSLNAKKSLFVQEEI